MANRKPKVDETETPQDEAQEPQKVGAMRVVYTGMTDSQKRLWLKSHEKYLEQVQRPRSTDWPEDLKIDDDTDEVTKRYRLQKREEWLEQRRKDAAASCDKMCRFKCVINHIFERDKVVDLGSVSVDGQRRFFTRDELIKVGVLVLSGPGGLQWDPDATEREKDEWTRQVIKLREEQLAERRRRAQFGALGG